MYKYVLYLVQVCSMSYTSMLYIMYNYALYHVKVLSMSCTGMLYIVYTYALHHVQVCFISCTSMFYTMNEYALNHIQVCFISCKSMPYIMYKYALYHIQVCFISYHCIFHTLCNIMLQLSMLLRNFDVLTSYVVNQLFAQAFAHRSCGQGSTGVRIQNKMWPGRCVLQPWL